MANGLNEVMSKTSTVCLRKRNDKKIILDKDSLNYAIEEGKINEVELLIQHGINIYETGSDNLTPIHVAAKYGRYEIIKLLVSEKTFLNSVLDQPQEHGFTPLYLAVQRNYLNCAKLLLDSGASVSSKRGGIYDPIHFAVFNNSVEMTTLLLDNGADINARFGNNFFEEFDSKIHRSLWLDHNLPLVHYSILRRFYDMVFLLVNRGADCTLKTLLEKTVLMQAVETNSQQLVKFLLQKKNVDVNERDFFGQPVLHFLILNAKSKDSMYDKNEIKNTYNKFFILQDLCKHGADINARFPENQARSSVIHYMIKYGFSVGVREVLFNQINFNFNEIDLTSIHSAQISTQHLTPDLINDHLYLDIIKNNYIATFNCIVERAVRHQMMGIPVNENLILEKPIIDYYSVESYKRRIQNFRENIMVRIELFKIKKVGDTDITIWHLLTCSMNELVELMSNKIIRDLNIVGQFYSIEYITEYIVIFNRRFCIAKRKRLLEDCSEIIFNLLIPYVPYHCCETIANNLIDQELDFLYSTFNTTDDKDLELAVSNL